jgi:prophage DNA circulation protein
MADKTLPLEDSDMPDDATDELHLLSNEVRAVTRERLDLAQRLANPAALRSATARAFRDRDAVTSPVLEEARSKIATDIAAFNKEWRQVDKSARDVERLAELLETAPPRIREHRDAIIAELPAVRQARARIAKVLKNAGLATILPDEANC